MEISPKTEYSWDKKKKEQVMWVKESPLWIQQPGGWKSYIELAGWVAEVIKMGEHRPKVQ